MAARTHERINQLPGVNDPFTPKVVICALRKHRLCTLFGYADGGKIDCIMKMQGSSKNCTCIFCRERK